MDLLSVFLKSYSYVVSMFILETKKNYIRLHFLFFPGSADEDSGVGGSPGCNNNNSSNRPVASNCHSCNVCHKKFSRADILRKHVKTHVSSSCSVCGQIFNDKVALAKHQSEVREDLNIFI